MRLRNSQKKKKRVVETGNYLGKEEVVPTSRALYSVHPSVQNKNMTLLLRIGSKTQ